MQLLSLPKAIIFDMDGTLYDQIKLRYHILLDILKFFIRQPFSLRDLKIIWDFRRMRAKQARLADGDLENQQYIWGAQASRVTPDRVRRVVQEWMFDRPLPHLAACRYPGTLELFSQLRKKGIKIAIFSDYPAREKLKALGLAADVIVCTTDKEVDRFKPDPKGLLVIAAKLQVAVQNCLVIGDQDDKDGECARQAGVPYIILDHRRKASPNTPPFIQIATWIEKCAS
jgi:phosphoglycolate phosphatase/putative hydrolase of the HAD superfamily